MRLGWGNGDAVRGSSAAALLLCVTMGVGSLALWTTAAVAADDDDDGGLTSSWSDRMSESIKNSIGKATKAVGIGKPPGPAPKEAPSGCPTIEILDGTQVQRVMTPGVTGNEGLRYQYSLHDVGRECSVAAGRVSVKVGASGRVLLGPVGAAGRFDVPIRVVVFSDADQRPVESKLFRVPATIGGGRASVPFEFVSDMISVPVAAGRTAADYSIKVGIDAGKGDGAPRATAKAGAAPSEKGSGGGEPVGDGGRFTRPARVPQCARRLMSPMPCSTRRSARPPPASPFRTTSAAAVAASAAEALTWARACVSAVAILASAWAVRRRTKSDNRFSASPAISSASARACSTIAIASFSASRRLPSKEASRAAASCRNRSASASSPLMRWPRASSVAPIRE